MFMDVDLSAEVAEKALGHFHLSEILESARSCLLEEG